MHQRFSLKDLDALEGVAERANYLGTKYSELKCPAYTEVTAYCMMDYISAKKDLVGQEKKEKVINFMNFLAYSRPIYNGRGFPTPVLQWTYSSKHDELDYYRIFWGGESVTQYLNSMLEWGKLFDNFLINRERYLQLDYLINSIYKDNEYHLIKDFSLCQLMLENKCEAELDIKLQRFLPDRLSNDEKQLCAKLLRQLRNKIAHGDFIAFEEKIEEYAIRFLDGKFEFDYSEYSRKNWTIEHVCCLLDDVLKKIFNMVFCDYETLENIKKPDDKKERSQGP